MYYIVPMNTTDIILSVFGGIVAVMGSIVTAILNQNNVLVKYKLNQVKEEIVDIKKNREADRQAALEMVTQKHEADRKADMAFLKQQHEEEKKSMIEELRQYLPKKKR